MAKRAARPLRDEGKRREECGLCAGWRESQQAVVSLREKVERVLKEILGTGIECLVQAEKSHGESVADGPSLLFLYFLLYRWIQEAFAVLYDVANLLLPPRLPGNTLYCSVGTDRCSGFSCILAFNRGGAFGAPITNFVEFFCILTKGRAHFSLCLAGA
jgi:hypothetical protein